MDLMTFVSLSPAERKKLKKEVLEKLTMESVMVLAEMKKRIENLENIENKKEEPELLVSQALGAVPQKAEVAPEVSIDEDETEIHDETDVNDTETTDLVPIQNMEDVRGQLVSIGRQAGNLAMACIKEHPMGSAVAVGTMVAIGTVTLSSKPVQALLEAMNPFKIASNTVKAITSGNEKTPMGISFGKDQKTEVELPAGFDFPNKAQMVGADIASMIQPNKLMELRDYVFRAKEEEAIKMGKQFDLIHPDEVPDIVPMGCVLKSYREYINFPDGSSRAVQIGYRLRSR